MRAQASIVFFVALVAGCGGDDNYVKSAETRAVEERAGDFLDYYEDVLRSARRYAAHPDSFRAALDSLPGSHLSDEDWEHWVAPYEHDPEKLSEHLEKVIADLSTRN